MERRGFTIKDFRCKVECLALPLRFHRYTTQIYPDVQKVWNAKLLKGVTFVRQKFINSSGQIGYKPYHHNLLGFSFVLGLRCDLVNKMAHFSSPCIFQIIRSKWKNTDAWKSLWILTMGGYKGIFKISKRNGKLIKGWVVIIMSWMNRLTSSERFLKIDNIYH